MVRQMRTLTRDMLVSIVIILIMTAGMLTMWIYNGINIPLKKLKEATQNIKEGNLDFVLMQKVTMRSVSCAAILRKCGRD